MADDTTDVDLGQTQTLAQGGYVVTWYTDAGTLRWRKIPVSTLAEIQEAAAASVNSSELGGAAFLDAEAFVAAEAMDAFTLAYDATVSELFARIAALEALIGVGLVVILEPGILEDGIVVG